MMKVTGKDCPAAVLGLLDRLHQAGEEAYLVGGSLRDSLLGRPPHDWDIATSALPDRTLTIFRGYPTVMTGIKHGTVTVIADEKLPVEITTYRIDGDYLDARHPSDVAFTRSLADDLARRDFTVCAMAWSPYGAKEDGEGELVDLFGGREDLARRIIRCVGEPEQRFREDALRILRAYRFSSELSFTVDAATRAGARQCAGLLTKISAERICSELSRTLLGPNAAAALAMMTEDGVLGMISHDFDHAAFPILPALPAELPLRLAAIFWRIPVSRAAAVMTALRFSGAVSRRTTAALSLRDLPFDSEDAALTVRRLLRAGGQAAAADLLTLRAAFGEEPGERPLTEYALALDHVLERGDCTDLSHLALDGDELHMLGIPRGPAIGRTLGRLLDAVIENPALNEKRYLTRLVEDWLREEKQRQ